MGSTRLGLKSLSIRTRTRSRRRHTCMIVRQSAWRDSVKGRGIICRWHFEWQWIEDDHRKRYRRSRTWGLDDDKDVLIQDKEKRRETLEDISYQNTCHDKKSAEKSINCHSFTDFAVDKKWTVTEWDLEGSKWSLLCSITRRIFQDVSRLDGGTGVQEYGDERHQLNKWKSLVDASLQSWIVEYDSVETHGSEGMWWKKEKDRTTWRKEGLQQSHVEKWETTDDVLEVQIKKKRKSDKGGNRWNYLRMIGRWRRGCRVDPENKLDTSTVVKWTIDMSWMCLRTQL